MTELELTVTQAAHALGIAERTCRKWLEEGRLEGRKDRKGNRDVWRIPAEACRKVRPDVTAAQGSLVETCHHAAKTRDVVAQAIGGMSGRTYEKAKVVVAAAEVLWDFRSHHGKLVESFHQFSAACLCGNFPRRGRQVTHRKPQDGLLAVG